MGLFFFNKGTREPRKCFNIILLQVPFAASGLLGETYPSRNGISAQEDTGE